MRKIIMAMMLFVALNTTNGFAAGNLYGDVDQDGKLTKADAKAVLNYTVKLILVPKGLSATFQKLADVSGNEKVTAYDSALILKKLAKIIDHFPVEAVEAETYLEKAKANLEEGKIKEAFVEFNQAWLADPENEEANFFHAAGLLFYDNAKINALMDRIGIAKEGRDIFNWTAAFSRDEDGGLSLPSDAPNTEEAQEFIIETVLPEFSQAITSLNKIKENFNVELDYSALGQKGKIEIDYGDVCLLKAFYTTLSAMLRGFNLYNIDLDNPMLFSLLDEKEREGIFPNSMDAAAIKGFIGKYPNLLTFEDASAMTQTKGLILEAIGYYFDAFEFINAENDDQTDDLISFSRYTDSLDLKDKELKAMEDKFNSTLLDVKKSLQGKPDMPFQAKLNQIVDLGFYFDHPFELRKFISTGEVPKFMAENNFHQSDYFLSNLRDVGMSYSYKLTPENSLLNSTIELDYGDVALLRSLLQITKAVNGVLYSYNLDVDGLDIYEKWQDGSLDIEEDCLQSYPQAATLKADNRLTESKTLIADGIDNFLSGWNFVKEKYTPKLSLDQKSALTKLLPALTEFKPSLYGATMIPNFTTQKPDDFVVLDLSRFFDTQPDIRDFFPELIFNKDNRQAKIVPGSFPDPTFGGIFPEFKQEDLVDHATAIGSGTFTITSGAIDTSGVTLSDNNAMTENFTITGSNELDMDTGVVILSGANRQVTVSTSTLTVGGVIDDGENTYSLTKAGHGTSTLSGANTFGGGATLKAGTLNINRATAIGSGTSTIENLKNRRKK